MLSNIPNITDKNFSSVNVLFKMKNYIPFENRNNQEVIAIAN